MRLSILYLLLFSSFAVCFYSCTPNPNGGIPFYMRMDSASLSTNYATQGYNTQNITDVWVTAGIDDLDAYQLPCNFPVLLENNVFFVVSAGIEEGGLVGYRVIYPFYQPDTFTLVATPGVKYKYEPKFKYKTSASFSFTPIDFEHANGFDSMQVTTDTNVRYGHACGQITVTATGDSNVLVNQLTTYPLPAGQEVWLEVDYKCDVPFNIGFWANSAANGDVQFPEIFVFAKPTWTKLYVSFSNDIATAAADNYNLYFEALRPYGSTGGHVYLDNIKVIHY